MFRRVSLVVAAAVLAAGVSAQQEEKFGAGITLQTATPLAALYENPQKFVGQTVRIDGIVTAVCEEMGCWMALGHDATGEQTVRFKVDHGASIVFPVPGSPVTRSGWPTKSAVLTAVTSRGSAR